jgi:hypothetical protein
MAELERKIQSIDKTIKDTNDLKNWGSDELHIQHQTLRYQISTDTISPSKVPPVIEQATRRLISLTQGRELPRHFEFSYNHITMAVKAFEQVLQQNPDLLNVEQILQKLEEDREKRRKDELAYDLLMDKEKVIPVEELGYELLKDKNIFTTWVLTNLPDSLTVTQREFILRRIEGMENEDIARSQRGKINVHTVESNISRGRQKIESVLFAKYGIKQVKEFDDDEAPQSSQKRSLQMAALNGTLIAQRFLTRWYTVKKAADEFTNSKKIRVIDESLYGTHILFADLPVAEQSALRVHAKDEIKEISGRIWVEKIFYGLFSENRVRTPKNDSEESLVLITFCHKVLT